MMNGHWKANEDVVVAGSFEPTAVNMGIGVVTPIDKVLGLIAESPVLQQRIAELRAQFASS